MCELEIGNFIAEKQKDGTFLYKSKNISDNLKKKVKLSYKDKPQFLIINTVEEEMKKDGKQMIFNSNKQIIQFLNSI